MKTMRFLSIAALVVVGFMMTGCSSEDIIADNVITLTTTVGFYDGGSNAAPNTRALASDGTKTFAKDEKIAVVYTNTSNVTVKAESKALTSSDITDSGKSAKFTVTLTNPKAGGSVKYIYPAAMAKDNGTENYDALATQDGTLSTLSSSLDLATYEGTLTGTAGLPESATLTNQLAILALTLKNSAGTSDLTPSTTFVTLSDGTNSYSINRSVAAGPIYVAIRPTSSASIYVTATTSTSYYVKSLTDKTYLANNGYTLSWKMSQSGAFTVESGKQVHFAPGNLQLVAENTWKFADNQWECFGNTQSNNHRDLFGWGAAYNPNNTGGNQDFSWDEWGSNANVQAGIGTGWRTLSKNEWNYLLFTRVSGSTVFSTTINNARFAKATIRTDVGDGVKGLIVFPDGVTIESSEVATAGTVNGGEDGWVTQCTSAQWTALASKGCVFLPAAGCRYGTTVQDVGVNGRYWSSSAGASSDKAYYLFFASHTVYVGENEIRCGKSVRLVRPVE